MPTGRGRVRAEADLALLAMGFTGSPMTTWLAENGIERASPAGYGTSDPRIFSCGDMRRGQSLVVGLFAKAVNARMKWTAFFARAEAGLALTGPGD